MIVLLDDDFAVDPTEVLHVKKDGFESSRLSEVTLKNGKSFRVRGLPREVVDKLNAPSPHDQHPRERNGNDIEE
ncbi:hypothetical protein V6767_20390 [Martelella sp. FLE1502]